LIKDNFFEVYAKLKDGRSLQAVKQDWDKGLAKDKEFQLNSLNQMAENMLLGV